ncbi:hypothetical protein M404DRAFT_36141 [Pisolithus tinctorius Marx 270]|uniref:Uncharacterized protein n=1 Tax=Pisolithus tinctorius Marx 270 TaxID=870435 RepID=A0A0C3NC60_PISTI|nr:hypothetical protein M404DRAFT_36141 [Pisolithus tinctorius Marx 270]
MIPFKYLLLAGYLFWPIITQVQRLTFYGIRGVCSVGWFYETGVCRAVASFVHAPDATRYVVAIQTEFGGLEDLLSSTNEVMPIVQSLTEAHLSIGDLVILVKSSSLSSHAVLVGELTAVAVETKEVVRGLQKLFAQVRGTVDVWVKAY